ncbi:MAG: aspartate aminotransferase family protein [Acidobacteria bacterium]|nr:aspartate aminotransferase family protein [Acidobacteriota bacterium]
MTAQTENPFVSISAPGIPRIEQREARLRQKTARSLARFGEAEAFLAGGVSSSLRRKARPWPLYYDRGSGSRLTDVDENTFLDYALGWGPLILGHRPDVVVDAVSRQLERGLTYGAQHELEISVAKRLTQLIPCADLVCFANSGTEVVQLALRLARAATGRTRHLKFEGHYHGWGDSVLQSYHPSRQELEHYGGLPVPVGQGQSLAGNVLIAEWNDRGSVERAFREGAGQVAAVICEPILCNSGCIMPEPGFLQFLREITEANGTLLIFDEVITGFRVHLNGAQGLFGVLPDLATYAKAAGAGTPLSVLGGRGEYMKLIAGGSVVHAGTLNGNPLCLAAAEAALDYLAADGGAVYATMNVLGMKLRNGIERILCENGHRVVTSGVGSVFQLSFMPQAALSYRDTLHADQSLYGDFALALLDEGILVLPDGRWYISTAHSEQDVNETLAAVQRVIA